MIYNIQNVNNNYLYDIFESSILETKMNIKVDI